MTWRLQLPQPLIRRIDLLAGSSSVVAIWTQPDRVHYYDQRSAKALGERVIDKMTAIERSDPRWRKFLEELRAPNGAYLPLVQTTNLTVYSSDDGTLHLYQLADDSLLIDSGSKEARLETEDGVRLISVDLDRQLGLIAGLDALGKLHLYQQRMYIGICETGLSMEGEFTPAVLTSSGGKTTVAVDSVQIVTFDAVGKVRKRLELHYPLAAVALSPDGRLLITADADTGVLRLYDADSLLPTHQRFAIDLAADARRLNAAAGGQIPTVVPSVLSVNNRGVIAFGLGGLLCVTSMSRMKALPASTRS